MKRSIDPSAVLAEALGAAPPLGRMLFAGEGAAAAALAVPRSTLWRREERAWPPDGPFDAAALRMSRSREAFMMALHALAANMREGAPLYVYGANDEGIRSAPKAFAPFFADAETVLAKSHARVWRARRTASHEGLCGMLADWRVVTQLSIGARGYDWVSYPGVFAHGRVDAGTALLISKLPAVTPRARALDFGAGSGLIARALVDSGATVDMLEADAVALEGARENVPEASAILGTDFSALGETRYDLIASNPPIHAGRARNLSMVSRLVAEAPRCLASSGTLLLVTERTVPVPRLAKDHFATIELIAERRGHRVWRLAKPLPKPERTS